jgi:hypothetical protein
MSDEDCFELTLAQRRHGCYYGRLNDSQGPTATNLPINCRQPMLQTAASPRHSSELHARCEIDHLEQSCRDDINPVKSRKRTAPSWFGLGACIKG